MTRAHGQYSLPICIYQLYAYEHIMHTALITPCLHACMYTRTLQNTTAYNTYVHTHTHTAQHKVMRV